MQGYSPKLPLSKDVTDGLYAMNKTALDSIKQDLKMLLLTNPGERIMIPEYGVGIRKLLFSQKGEELNQTISSNIRKQVKIYMNFVNIKEITILDIENNENAIYIKLVFSVPSLNSTDELILSLASN